MNSLTNKKGLIIGVANDQSIAYGCAKHIHAAGGEVAITYLNHKAEPHVRPLAEKVNSPLILPCNVQNPGELEQVFEVVDKTWGSLDFVIHSIAFAPLADLHGRVTDCSVEGFLQAMDVSVHSLIRMTKLAEPLMKNGGSILTMSYYGAQKVVENYNMMGPVKAALESVVQYLAVELSEKAIRINTISPGPLKTRAASGIKDFDKLIAMAQSRIANYDQISIEDVGALAAFLVSDGAKALSGGTYFVDGGLNAVGA